MKLRSHFSGFMAGLFLFPAVALAQDSPAVGTAAREESEANSRRMNTKIEQLEDTLQAQQKKLNTLVTEIHTLRTQAEAPGKRNEIAALKESVKTLAAKIEEVDRKRMADNKLILERLNAIAKAIKASVAAPEAAPKEQPDNNPASGATGNKPAAKTKKVDTATR
jgi:septal ring factor EnvC (AmiA/AmiB activator)